MWERKARVFTNWLVHLFWGRDFSSVRRVQRPRDFFEEFASRPAVAAKKAPSKKAVAGKKASSAKKAASRAKVSTR
jgi:NADH dehydrogenase